MLNVCVLLITFFIVLKIYEIYLLEKIAKQKQLNNNIKNNNKLYRKHEKLAKTSFTSALDPYEKYKDKSTKLYVPRRQGGGVKIEGDKE